MKSISLSEIQSNPQTHKQIKEILEEGKLLCFPTTSGYKLAADLNSPSAISAMIQAKRRVKNAPALVFVPDVEWVAKIVSHVSGEAKTLMESLWPGHITLLFQASDDLPSKIRKPLMKAKGWLGVRIPSDDSSRLVLTAFGKPLLVSSANIAKKHGANSLAQVKKNFGRTVSLLIEEGDINEGPKSTLVDLTSEYPEVIRAGAVSEETIKQALAG